MKGVSFSQLSAWLAREEHCDGLPCRGFDRICDDGSFAPRPIYACSLGRGKHSCHSSHRLAYKAGAIFCWKCGAYSQQRLQLLGAPCPGHPKEYGRQNLRRLRLGKHPCHLEQFGARYRFSDFRNLRPEPPMPEPQSEPPPEPDPDHCPASPAAIVPPDEEVWDEIF